MIVLFTAIALILCVASVVIMFLAIDGLIIAVNWIRAWVKPAGSSGKHPTS